MAKGKTTAEPIMDNEHVKELLAVLREHNSPSTKDFLAVLNQVGAMEKQLDAVVKELAAMRQELKTAQEQNHPVKTTLQNAVIVTQGQVLDLRERLTQLKQNIIDGCKNAVAAFKETGISALDNVARFFKVRPILETMRDTLTKDIQYDDKAIAEIEAISTEYHQAGRHLKNMGRAMLGKEVLQEVKAPGKLAAVISAPFRAERSHLISMKGHVEKSLNALARLEERAAEKKPSIRETIEAHNEQIAQAKKDAPTAERPRPANAER
ncbi:DUF6674 family protein [Lachnospiraceae bacterium 54-53]